MYEIFNLDCRDAMRYVMDARSVQTVITSPPYFGLRDYGHAGQIGLEASPDEFVAAICSVADEIWRVLRDDGTLWLNLGDSYNAAGRKGHGVKQGTSRASAAGVDTCWPFDPALKPKDLIGIPWRVAFALQARGWYLRQDIIWHKPNPMPESVRDRCVKAHEYIFLLTKSERYYFNHEAMREPGVYPAGTKGAKGRPDRAAQKGVNSRPPEYKIYDGMRTRRDVWTVTSRPYNGAHFATFPVDLIEPCVLAGSRPGDVVFDPFGGAGTTAIAAMKHGRRAVLAELNPAYVELAHERIRREIRA